MLKLWTGSRKQEGEGLLGGVPLGTHPWLVLGGGGLKGLAHLGAWRVLQEAGFQPAGILGTSIGGLVGACLAAGRPIEELEAEAHSLVREDIAHVQRRVIWLKMNGVRSTSLFSGEVLRRYLKRVLPEAGWEGLEIRFQTNAVELGTGRTEWFGIGGRTDVPLADAVYASAALPLFYPPIPLPGGIYVDGGATHALPLHRAAELGATGIVAIDVGAQGQVDPEGVVKRGMLAIHERVFQIMSGRMRTEAVAGWDGVPLLYIRPRLDGYGNFAFDEVETFLGEGRRAATEALGLGTPETAVP